nr:TIGR02680 family protein [Micromonospora acroterricola]
MNLPMGLDGVQPPSRWRLHRGGILNIWEYGAREFDLSGGRAVLQGSNGSGKSRTLELALPFCLDGDLRNLGAKGYDSVSVRRLMLDHYNGGPNRIGYSWMELRRVRDDGAEEFLSCGIGIKASKATDDIANSWRFITEARVGIDFRLATAENRPLDIGELKDVIGAQAVVTDPDLFRSRVAAAVYGIDDLQRYDDLLHLQRTLRNPDVGVKAVAGQLEEYLGEALPPLEPEILNRLANQFQDLEAIRENIERLGQADESLSRFLVDYRDYLQSALRERATNVTQAQEALDAHRTAASQRQDELGIQRGKAGEAQRNIDELERAERELKAQIDELKGSDEYKDHRDLADKRAMVAALKRNASISLSNAAVHRSSEERACSTVLDVLNAAQRAGAQAAEEAHAAADLFADVGSDRSVIPTVPSVPRPSTVTSREYVQITAEPDGVPQPVQRSAPPAFDLDALRNAVVEALAQAERARVVAERRSVVAASLLQTAERLDGELGEIDKLKATAEGAADAAREASERHEQRLRTLTAEAVAWLTGLAAWADSCPLTAAALAGRPAAPTTAELIDEPVTVTRGARMLHLAWIAPAVVQARHDASDARAQYASLEAEQGRLDTELQALRAGGDVLPPHPEHPRASRARRPGAPFYQLVDFRAALSEDERGGLEGALQASGLLDAWVNPDGGLSDPDLNDLVAVALTGPHPAGHLPNRLASALVATPPAQCQVPIDVVDRLLAAVLLDDGQATTDQMGVAVSTSGRWRAGNLTGAWHKPCAEYVGPSTREATRQRMIAGISAQHAEVTRELAAEQVRSDDLAAAVATWERQAEHFPEPVTLVTAHAESRMAEDIRDTAEEQTKAKIKVHAEAFARWQADRAVLSRNAAESNLPSDTGALGARCIAIGRAIEACKRLRGALGQLQLAIVDIAGATAKFDEAAASRAEAEQQAGAAHGTYAEAAKALQILAENLGVAGDQLERTLTGLATKLQKAQADLPLQRNDRQRADRQIVTLETLIGLDQTAEQEKQEAVTAAEKDFDQVARAPGVWLAATGESDPPPASREDALRVVHTYATTAVNEGHLVNSLQRLQAALPNGHEAHVDAEVAPLIVHVSDGEQHRPVADAARHTHERLHEDQQKLDDRYQKIFERFLLRDLAEHLRRHIDAADDLCRRMNTILAGAQSSQGVHVQLSWAPSPALDDATRQALELVGKSLAVRNEDQDNTLRKALQDRIEAERDKRDVHYAQVLAHALDYRSWYTFTVRVQDFGPDGRSRNRRLRQLSSGETRLVSYMTLFAAAAAFYDALSTPGTRPLRLVLLDEAFERLDDPTITRLLELLAEELDMDWIITWPGGSAFSPKISRMHIYDVFRPKGAPGIAFVHTTWDGATAARQQP